MSDAVCVFVCACVSYAWEVGACFVLLCLHEPFLVYFQTAGSHLAQLRRFGINSS